MKLKSVVSCSERFGWWWERLDFVFEVVLVKWGREMIWFDGVVVVIGRGVLKMGVSRF